MTDLPLCRHKRHPNNKKSGKRYYKFLPEKLPVMVKSPILAGLPGRARLVGKTLGLAPDELQLPWYRVMRSGGQLAFAAGTPQALAQQQLLLAEGVIVRNGRVAKDFWWQPDLSELLFKLQY